ncbi:unnamed protein product [Ectocarpus sp. 13 AM-2016]
MPCHTDCLQKSILDISMRQVWRRAKMESACGPGMACMYILVCRPREWPFLVEIPPPPPPARLFTFLKGAEEVPESAGGRVAERCMCYSVLNVFAALQFSSCPALRESLKSIHKHSFVGGLNDREWACS